MLFNVITGMLKYSGKCSKINCIPSVYLWIDVYMKHLLYLSNFVPDKSLSIRGVSEIFFIILLLKCSLIFYVYVNIWLSFSFKLMSNFRNYPTQGTELNLELLVSTHIYFCPQCQLLLLCIQMTNFAVQSKYAVCA